MTMKLLRSLGNRVAKREEPAATGERLPSPAAKMGYLSEIEIFHDLSKEEMDWVAAITTMTSCDRGRIFYIPGETSEVLFLLKKGRVQLYRTSAEGKKLVLATLEAGTLFGEMAMLGQGMHSSFAEAVDECVLCVMSRTDLERLLTQKPLVALRLVEVLGRRVRELESQVEDIAFKSIRARLASRLLSLAEQTGSDDIADYTHQDLADMVGTYRETATQVLNELKSEGVIDTARKRVIILDRKRLSEIAGE